MPSTLILWMATIQIRVARAFVMKLSNSMKAYMGLIHSMSYDNTLCMGKIESVWYRITDKSDSSMSKILSSCGSKLTKFTDIS